MMIEYVTYSHGNEELFAPAYICDLCEKQCIDSGTNQGLVLWYGKFVEDIVVDKSPLFTLHKGHCCSTFESSAADKYPSSTWTPFWEELDRFLQNLTYNASHHFTEDGTYQVRRMSHL